MTNLKRALSDEQVERILMAVVSARAAAIAQGREEPSEHAVRDELLRAGALPGDLVSYLSTIAHGLSAADYMSEDERLRRLRAFCEPFNFEVRRDPAARKTFGYVFTPKPLH